MKKYFLDTNIFLRFLVGDNKKMLGECLTLFDSIKGGKVDAVTSNVVLSEVVWTLGSLYKYPKSKIIDAIKGILGFPGIKIIDGCMILIALEIYQGVNIKFIDSLIASIDDIYNGRWVVVSYDKDFDKLGVIRKEPSEII